MERLIPITKNRIEYVLYIANVPPLFMLTSTCELPPTDAPDFNRVWRGWGLNVNCIKIISFVMRKKICLNDKTLPIIMKIQKTFYIALINIL